MARIVVVGSTNVDMVVRAPRIPRPGETVLGGEFLLNPGGKGANQAVAAARLGGEVTLTAVARAVELAKKHGRRVLLNPAPYMAVPDAILSRIDILTPNETEAEMLLGGGEAGLGGIAGTAEELLRRGVGCVIVTMG